MSHMLELTEQQQPPQRSLQGFTAEVHSLSRKWEIRCIKNQTEAKEKQEEYTAEIPNSRRCEGKPRDRNRNTDVMCHIRCRLAMAHLAAADIFKGRLK